MFYNIKIAQKYVNPNKCGIECFECMDIYIIHSNVWEEWKLRRNSTLIALWFVYKKYLIQLIYH